MNRSVVDWKILAYKGNEEVLLPVGDFSEDMEIRDKERVVR